MARHEDESSLGMKFELPELHISALLTADKPSIVTEAGGIAHQVESGGQGRPTTLPGAGEIVSINRPDPWRVKGQSAPGTGSTSSAEHKPRQRAPRRSGQPRRPSQG